jgi:phosphatidylglycerophosphatase A
MHDTKQPSMSTSTPEPPAARPLEPSFGWLWHAPARVVAFGFGSGLLRPAPGTWGTLAGWVLWVLIVGRLSDAAIAAVLVLAFAYGCWCCHRVGRELGEPDHSGMVWDEITAFWLVLWLTPGNWGAQLTAFILFRAFDIVKPAPIGFFDRHFKNGFGVMWDDIIAAAYALLVMAILVRLELLL